MQVAYRTRRRNQTVLTVAALAGLGLAPAAVTRAADIHWNVADGNWDTAASWVGAVVPGNADRGIIDRTGGGIARVTTDIVDVKGISVAVGNTLSVETGGIATTLANTPDDNPADGVWIADGGSGFANVSGGGTLVTTGGGYQGTIGVGRGGGTGTMTISGASLVDGNDVHIGGTNLPGGTASAGTGTVTLSAGTLNARAWSFVGRDGGSGTLNMSGGLFNSNGESHVGFSGGTGVVAVSGGTYQVGGQLHIGDGGSTGSMTVTGGVVTAGNDLMVGTGNGGSGTVNQSAGVVSDNGGWAFVGRTGANGLYNLSGTGTMNVNGQMNVGFEPGGVGTFNQSGGLATFRELPHVGRAGGNGTYNLSGGTLAVGEKNVGSADDDLVVGADFGTTGVLNQTGGTLTSARWIFAGRAGNSGGGTGTINQSAGTLSSQGWMRLGEAPGAIGTYNLSGTAQASIGGGDTDLGDDDLILGVDFGAQGILTVAGTADLNVARDITMGLNGGSGTMTQSAGTVDVNSVVFVGASGTVGGAVGSGTLSTTGGTLNVGLALVAGHGGDVAGNPTNTTGEINIGGTATVNVSGATIVGENIFAGSTGAGVLNQTGGTLTTGSLAIAAFPGATGDYNLTGGRVTSLGTTNNGTFDISNAAIASLGPVSGTGAMTVAGTASVSAQHVRQSSLSMTGGTIAIAPTGNGAATGTSSIPSFSLSGTAKFDVGDNKLITNAPVGTGAVNGGNYTAGSVSRYVQTASNGGAWDGPGLTTSRPDATGGLTSIGVAAASDVRDFGVGTTLLFGGQTITPSSTLAMYTYAGDANLDGQITGDDYSGIDFTILDPNNTGGWFNGDFNYDGFVSGDDYSAIDFNILAQGAPFATAGGAGLSGVTAVPEPATFSLLGLGAISLIARRRRAAK